MQWLKKMFQNFESVPTVTLTLNRDELVKTVDAFQNYKEWDHSDENWVKSLKFQHEIGSATREIHGGRVKIVQCADATIGCETKIVDGHAVDVVFRAPRKKIATAPVNLFKLKAVEVSYRLQFGKKNWVYDVGLLYRAASLAGIEKIITTGEKPAKFYVRITHANWESYYGKNTTDRAAASVILKIKDILKAIEK